MHESVGNLRHYLRERIWQNRKLSDRDRSLSLYLLTGDQTNEAGLYCFSSFRASQVLGWHREEVERQLPQTATLQAWKWDAEAGVLWICDWFQAFPPEGREDFPRLMETVRQLPPTPLVAEWARRTDDLPHELREPFTYSVASVLAPEVVVGCDLPAKPLKPPPALTAWKFITEDGKHWTLEEKRYRDYVKTFSRTLDVDMQLKMAQTWLKNNKRKRKTPQGMPAFLTRWLNNATERLSGRAVAEQMERRRADPRGNAAALEKFMDMIGAKG